MVNTNTKFEKTYRLLNKNDFQNLRDGSRLFVSDVLLFYVKKNTHKHSRIGIAISKKYGKAVFRNRMKRLIRESFRKNPLKSFDSDILVAMNFKKIKREKLSIPRIETMVEQSLNNAFENGFKR